MSANPLVYTEFTRFLSLQRMRAKAKGDRIVARYRRRVNELAIDRPSIISRGPRQVWHRDTADQQRGYEA